MKILAVEHSFPETAYSNAAVIDRVTASSRDFLSFDDLVHSVGFLEQMFQTSGSENRYLGDGRERPIDLVVEASRRALATAGVGPKDLDFVIFGGVTRGFLVPSSASAVQHALGASGASCFDVLDACASWLRALQTARRAVSYWCQQGWTHRQLRMWEFRRSSYLGNQKPRRTRSTWWHIHARGGGHGHRGKSHECSQSIQLLFLLIR